MIIVICRHQIMLFTDIFARKIHNFLSERGLTNNRQEIIYNLFNVYELSFSFLVIDRSCVSYL